MSNLYLFCLSPKSMWEKLAPGLLVRHVCVLYIAKGFAQCTSSLSGFVFFYRACNDIIWLQVISGICMFSL